MGRCDDAWRDLRVEAGEVMAESMVCCESAATDDRPSSSWVSPDDDEDDEATVDGGIAWRSVGVRLSVVSLDCRY